MTPDAQLLFFSKVRAMFDRATVGIVANAKKKCRLNADELLRVRNVSVLFAQLQGFLKLAFHE